jgi:hypothetical protein
LELFFVDFAGDASFDWNWGGAGVLGCEGVTTCLFSEGVTWWGGERVTWLRREGIAWRSGERVTWRSSEWVTWLRREGIARLRCEWVARLPHPGSACNLRFSCLLARLYTKGLHPACSPWLLLGPNHNRPVQRSTILLRRRNWVNRRPAPLKRLLNQLKLPGWKQRPVLLLRVQVKVKHLTPEVVLPAQIRLRKMSVLLRVAQIQRRKSKPI